MADILYKAELNVTGVQEFGCPLDAALSGNTPPEGARVNVSFAGPIRGQVEGTLEGVDYLRFRADGRAELDLHGAITLTDGRMVAWRATGVAMPRPESPVIDISEMIQLDHNHADLAWLSGRAITARGEVDLSKGTISVTAYV